MKKNYLLFIILGVLLTSCSNKDNKTINTQNQSLEFSFMDTTIIPGEDFYQYANGNWLANNPIPEEESRWSSFNVLSDKNNTVLNEILLKAKENADEKGSVNQLIGDYYASFLDTNKRNIEGLKSIETYYNLIDSIKEKEDVQSAIAVLQNRGISSLFGLYVSQDKKNNEIYRVHLHQGGIGLPNRDYYFKEDERSEKIRDQYHSFVGDMLEMGEISGRDAENKIYNIEIQLAEASKSPVELRDIESSYNPMTVEDLQETCSFLNWSAFLKHRNISIDDTLIVGQPLFFNKINDLFRTVSIEDWKLYLKWNLIRSMANHLTMDLSRKYFEFYSTTLRGTKKMKPLWKRGISAVTSSAIGEALGEAFVEENFSQNAKDKVNQMVDNITFVFDQRIEELDWMSDSTKLKAKEKLYSFARKLGFPDEWEDFSAIDISRESYAKNRMECNVYEVNKNISLLGEPIDRKKWSMFPQIVNAYYNPLLNEIVFPAGIMQRPFFSEEYEDAVNYARMGAVIGHELTHGFDDMGSKFSADGRMINWWTEEDKDEFDKKTQKLVDQYNAFEVLTDVFVNGKLTLGENIADLGGLTIAYYSYIKSLDGKEKNEINGFTPEQRFFIAFAHVWKNNIRENALIARIKNDPHSPGKYRVNGTLSNMPEFFEAFNIKEGEAMRQSEDKISRIW